MKTFILLWVVDFKRKLCGSTVLIYFVENLLFWFFSTDSNYDIFMYSMNNENDSIEINKIVCTNKILSSTWKCLEVD